jgi:5-methylcytosine-specific restriction endonuclease McrA
MKVKHTLSANPRVLVLNVAYMPIDVISWEDAMNQWSNGKAQILETYENTDLRVRSAQKEDGRRQVDFVCPSVIYMPGTPVNHKTMVNQKPLNRRSLYETYHGKCCYCKIPLSYDEFTLEHVIPQSKGGLTTWENCGIACRECNAQKGDIDLELSGMKLQYKIGTPTTSHKVTKSIASKIGASVPSQSWVKYLTWNITIV